MEDKDKIPLNRVLDDMYSNNDIISSAAKDYYYENYASEDEKLQYMKHQENMMKILYIIKWVVLIVIFIIFGSLLMEYI